MMRATAARSSAAPTSSALSGARSRGRPSRRPVIVLVALGIVALSAATLILLQSRLLWLFSPGFSEAGADTVSAVDFLKQRWSCLPARSTTFKGGIAKVPIDRQGWLQRAALAGELTTAPFYLLSPLLQVVSPAPPRGAGGPQQCRPPPSSAPLAASSTVALNEAACGAGSSPCFCAASPFWTWVMTMPAAVAAAAVKRPDEGDEEDKGEVAACTVPLGAFDAAVREAAAALSQEHAPPLVLHDRSETLRAVTTTKYGRQDNNPADLAAALASGSAAALKRALLLAPLHASPPHVISFAHVLLSPDGAAHGVDAGSGMLGGSVSVQTCGSAPKQPPALGAALASVPLYDEVLVLTHRWSANPYHYAAEALVNRLYPLLHHFAARSEVHFLLTSDSDDGGGGGSDGGSSGGSSSSSGFKPVHLEALAAFGIAPQRVLRGWVRARLAHLPEGVVCAHPHPLGLVLGREAIRAAVGLPAVSPVLSADAAAAPSAAVTAAGTLPEGPAAGSTKGCLLGRRATPLRVLLPKRVSQRVMRNFDRLLSGLRELPVDAVVLPDDALPPQAEIWRTFGGADAVVSQNGAALANIVAMRPGAAVFEVAQFYHMSFHFAHMAAVLGLPFHQYVTNTTRWSPVIAPVQRILRDVCDFGLGLPPRE